MKNAFSSKHIFALIEEKLIRIKIKVLSLSSLIYNTIKKTIFKITISIANGYLIVGPVIIFSMMVYLVETEYNIVFTENHLEELLYTKKLLMEHSKNIKLHYYVLTNMLGWDILNYPDYQQEISYEITKSAINMVYIASLSGISFFYFYFQGNRYLFFDFLIKFTQTHGFGYMLDRIFYSIWPNSVKNDGLLIEIETIKSQVESLQKEIIRQQEILESLDEKIYTCQNLLNNLSEAKEAYEILMYLFS